MDSSNLISGLASSLTMLGIYIKDAIILVAEGLTKSESSPGLVALLFFISLLICGLLYVVQTRRQTQALRGMETLVTNYEDIPDFAENYGKHSPRAVWRSVVAIVYRLSLWTHMRTPAVFKFCRSLIPAAVAVGRITRRFGSLRKAMAMA